jgi:signal transduction histidine kinase
VVITDVTGPGPLISQDSVFSLERMAVQYPPQGPSGWEGRQKDDGGTDLANKVLEIALSVLYHRDEDKIMEIIGQAMIDLFPVSKVVMYLTDRATGDWRVRAVFGFPKEQADGIGSVTYSKDNWKETLRISERIGALSYFAIGEYVKIDDYDTAFYWHIPKIVPPRRSPNDWYPLDFIDTLLFDKDGRELGAIEILETSDGKKVRKETIAQIEILASVASIAIELSSIWRHQEQLVTANSNRARMFAKMLDLTASIVASRDRGRILGSAVDFLSMELGFSNTSAAVWDPREKAFSIVASGSYGPVGPPLSRQVVEGDCEVTYRFTENLYWVPVEQLTEDRLSSPPVSGEQKSRIKELMAGQMTSDTEAERRKLDLFVIPLRGSDNEIVGVIYGTDRRGEGIFEKDLLEVMSVFGSTVSLAFRNSGLIREIIQTNENLEVLNRLLFHDISNYNTTLDLYLGMCSRQGVSGEEVSQLVAKARKQLEMSNALINRVRRLVFIKEKGAENLKAMDILPVLTNLVDQIRDSKVEKKVSVTLDADVGQAMVRANDLVFDLFENLLTNSMKYTPRDEVEIEVSIRKTMEGGRDWWEITVADHGSGIPDDKKEQIFQRFTPRFSGGKGIGIGLSIVKQTVEHYGGRIWVGDRVKGDHGQGASFHVLLPAV